MTSFLDNHSRPGEFDRPGNRSQHRLLKHRFIPAEGTGLELNFTSGDIKNNSDTAGHPGGTESGARDRHPRCDISRQSTESFASSGKNEAKENGPSDQLETLIGSFDQLETLKRLARCLSPEQRRQLAEWLIRAEG